MKPCSFTAAGTPSYGLVTGTGIADRIAGSLPGEAPDPTGASPN